MLRLTSWADPFSAAADDEDTISKTHREQSYTAQLSPIKDLPESLSLHDFEQATEEKRVKSLQR
jgi:hypothetical protein